MAGAQFVIAPNLDEGVGPYLQSVSDPLRSRMYLCDEAVKGLEYGAAFIKAFPISDFYGPKLVSVFKTPIPFMPILASGGITLDNLSTYVKNGVDCCGFGGLLTKGSSADIAENARRLRVSLKKPVRP